MSNAEVSIPQQWVDIYNHWGNMGEIVRAINFGENIFESVTGNHMTGTILPDLVLHMFGSSREPLTFTDIGASIFPSIQPSVHAIREAHPHADIHAQLLDPTYTLPFVRNITYAKMADNQPYTEAHVPLQEQQIHDCIWEVPLSIAHTELIADSIPGGMGLVRPAEVVTATHMLNYVDQADIPGIFDASTCYVCIVDGLSRGFPYKEVDLHPRRFRTFDDITAIAEASGFHLLYTDSMDDTPNIRGFIFIRD